MTELTPTLAAVLKHLQQVPYLASKNIYRVAHHFLLMDPQRLQQFCAALQDLKTKVVSCSICATWQERGQECQFCFQPGRNQQVICVVETWYDLWAIERSGSYSGVYHVLGGSICPLEGRGPDDLTIDVLIKRLETHQATELILAMNQTPEGEATAAYIARKVEPFACKVTCLARGVPVGGHLEQLDRLTVQKALNERRPF